MFFPESSLEYRSKAPCESLKPIVDSIWMVKNHSPERKEGVVLPDGKIDLFLLGDETDNFRIFRSGICTDPIIKPPFPKSTMFAISFHPVAAEYLFKTSFAQLANATQTLPTGYWGFCKADLAAFEGFYDKACRIISQQCALEIDNRKKELFERIRAARGEITVRELSRAVFWSSRQINRYFQAWYGIPLKTYLNIIRFSNALKPLQEGTLFPEGNYGDQSHFIRSVRQFSGVRPAVLSKNENGRFIQLSLLADG